MYILNDKKEIVILDISNKIDPKIVNRINVIEDKNIDKKENHNSLISTIAYNNDLMVISTNERLYIYSIKDLKKPILISNFYYNTKNRDLGKSISDKNPSSSDLKIIDTNFIPSVVMNEKKIYLRLNKNYIDVINISDINNPKFSNSYKVNTSDNGELKLKNEKLFLFGSFNSLGDINIYDTSSELDLIPLKTFGFRGTSFVITDQDICIFLKDDRELLEYNISDLNKDLDPTIIFITENSEQKIVFNNIEYLSEYESYLKKRVSNDTKK